MALSSAYRTLITPGGKTAGYLFGASGLAADIKRFQAGELYVDAINEVTATGFFKYHYPINLIPRIQVTPGVGASGLGMHVSASGEDHFVVSFTNSAGTFASPVIDPLVATPHHVGTWLAIL